MKRREVLKLTSSVLGYSVAGGTLAAITAGCKADPKPQWKPKYLEPMKHETLAAIVDVIIPRTDTPGALDALVDRYLDEAYGKHYTEREQIKFLQAIQFVNEVSNTLVRSIFVEANDENQNKVLEFMVNESKKNKNYRFNLLIKNTVAAYFSSEVAAKEVLFYDPVPGPYQGCIPLSEVGNVNSAL